MHLSGTGNWMGLWAVHIEFGEFGQINVVTKNMLEV